MNKHNLELLRSDLGDGGWSLHDGDGPPIIDGPATWVEGDGWDRPNQADYDACDLLRRLLITNG